MTCTLLAMPGHEPKNPLAAVTGTVQIEDVGSEVGVSVSDHGMDIPGATPGSIVDRSYRTANAADGAEGFGIGLCVTRMLVGLHSGRIVVTSEPGHGSTFRFARLRGAATS